MSPPRLLLAAVLAAGLLSPGVAAAQTANGSPMAPAPPGLVGTPRPVSRTAPSAGTPRVSSNATLTAGRMQPPPKPTAAERAEQKKLEHDLHICTGC